MERPNRRLDGKPSSKRQVLEECVSKNNLASAVG
jgi:hypothetical protein